MSDFGFALVPPGVLLVGWVGLWATGRRISPWFFVAGVSLAVLCFPAGVVLEQLTPPCDNPDRDTWACGYSEPFLTGILSALLTAACVVGLLLLTAFLKLFGLQPGAGDPPQPGR